MEGEVKIHAYFNVYLISKHEGIITCHDFIFSIRSDFGKVLHAISRQG
jgi:hypothetical protein